MIVDTKHKSHDIRPCPRIGSATINHEGGIYVIGGHDEANEKLDDFWKFDLKSSKWTQIHAEGQLPIGRNGHTTVLVNNKLVMFGGILEITKESDDLYTYDFTTNKW
jgi:N-acetylneuraminic acid mutarotase